MRRALCPLVATLVVVALGCQESGFDESKETSKPLKVQHALGESKVPGQAERPMTLTIDTLDDTLALQVRPVRAAVPGAKLPPYLRAAGRGVSTMPPVTAADLPDVEAVDPDLILGTAEGQGKLWDDLSKIAPTVMTDGGGGQWKLSLRLTGEALGRTNDAEQLLIDYDREAAEARRAIEGSPRVAVARMTSAGRRYATRMSFAGTILADVGVKQATGPGADMTLLTEPPNALTHVDGGRFVRVSDVWWGDGGALAAKTALEELRAALAR